MTKNMKKSVGAAQRGHLPSDFLPQIRRLSGVGRANPIALRAKDANFGGNAYNNIFQVRSNSITSSHLVHCPCFAKEKTFTSSLLHQAKIILKLGLCGVALSDH